MKVFYAIFFLVAFVLATDAQTQVDFVGITAKAGIFNTTDSTITDSPDKIGTEDSLLNVPDIEVISKPRFGLASFYSKNLEGTTTATGETFRHNYLTAASNNFKLNSWVRVTNLINGKEVIVRINDRMHPSMSKKGRLVDLSIAAAREIGLSNSKGVTKVKVEEISLCTVLK